MTKTELLKKLRNDHALAMQTTETTEYKLGYTIALLRVVHGLALKGGPDVARELSAAARDLRDQIIREKRAAMNARYPV